MTKTKVTYTIFSLLLFLFLFNNFSFKSNANPFPVTMASLGTIIPRTDSNCSMIDAGVIVDIDATNLNKKIDLLFKGNYSIYNPDDEINITIAAPFDTLSIAPTSRCEIKMNGSPIPFEIIDVNEDELEGWFKEFFDIWVGIRFLLCNITISANSAIILEYLFNATMTINLNDLGYLFLHYYIGTAAAWNGLITESVQFNVIGRIPDEYYNRSCTVTRYIYGNSYLWEWEDEFIKNKDVYIVYHGNYKSNPLPAISFGKLFPFLIITCILGLICITKLKIFPIYHSET